MSRDERGKKIKKICDEWINRVIHTEAFQRRHMTRFGYQALVEACRKFNAKILIPKPKSSRRKKS